MKLGLTKKQAGKIGKTALYIGVSAIISYLITLTTEQPNMLGAYTGLVNLLLVSLKQLFTEDK